MLTKTRFVTHSPKTRTEGEEPRIYLPKFNTTNADHFGYHEEHPDAANPDVFHGRTLNPDFHPSPAERTLAPTKLVQDHAARSPHPLTSHAVGAETRSPHATHTILAASATSTALPPASKIAAATQASSLPAASSTQYVRSDGTLEHHIPGYGGVVKGAKFSVGKGFSSTSKDALAALHQTRAADAAPLRTQLV